MVDLRPNRSISRQRTTNEHDVFKGYMIWKILKLSRDTGFEAGTPVCLGFQLTTIRTRIKSAVRLVKAPCCCDIEVSGSLSGLLERIRPA